MELWGDRIIQRDFRSAGSMEYLIKDLGMALEDDCGSGERGGSPAVLPGAALCRQLSQAVVANREASIGIQGLITAIERINGK
ncbi:hypothetical protein HPP92_023019 [Vanilla planifolia]|uniref:Uncharacterized protein n=1 Tax=Vanilla planifolia TaxID=51239 RepID=A0A835PT70_VANPL|nr:hypothetical protein HPP92_023019 [Vanilla planifolia]